MGGPLLDLRASLTVFVSTVGYPTFDDCLEHLAAQDCAFRLEIVDHVAPMSAALQRMMDECATPYFVQVDEDMLLYPHAVRTLYQRLSAMDARVAQYVCALYDVHLEQAIYALKIFRHGIVARYPYRDVAGCEWDQIRRFRADGYVDVRVPLAGATRDSENTLGLHGTCWTPSTVYLRYCVLELMRRRGNKTYAWVVDAAHTFLRRFLETRSEIDFHALMGVLAGALSASDTRGKEKDFREYGRTPGFAPLQRFADEARRGWHDNEPLRPGEFHADVLQNER
ncbi:MAG: hypothetical protein ACREMB_17995 [Candidatus Rokuibacteriota bacterium]